MGLPPESGASQSPKNQFSPSWSVVSHTGDCFAGRPALDWLLTDGCTLHRAKKTQLCGTGWCRAIALNCTLPHHHLASRDPRTGGGWREPLNPTWAEQPDGKVAGAPNTETGLKDSQLIIGRRASRAEEGYEPRLSTGWPLKPNLTTNHKGTPPKVPNKVPFWQKISGKKNAARVMGLDYHRG